MKPERKYNYLYLINGETPRQRSKPKITDRRTNKFNTGNQRLAVANTGFGTTFQDED